MGRVLRVLLTLAGVLLLAVGGGAAAYIGSDDTVFNQAADVGADGRPVVTVPDLFSYDDLKLTVRASAPKGVFLGTANGVDIADYTKDAPYFELVGLKRSGVSGSDHAGKAEKLPVPPAKADFWTDQVSGTGTQTLSQTVDGLAPPRFVIVPVGGQGPTTVSFGATIDGLFVAALAVAAAGLFLLLLALGWMLFSRHRRNARRRQPVMPAQNYPKAPIYRRLAVPVVLSGLLVTSGCGTLPAKVDYVPPTKVALTSAELPALWKSLDQRLKKAARKAGPKKYDASHWSYAVSGPMLEADLRNTMYDELTSAKKGQKPAHHTGLSVYSGQFDSYPMWALVTMSIPLPASQSASGLVGLAVVTRESSTSPWLWHSGIDVPHTELPELVEPTPVPAAITKKASGLAASLMKYWRTGKKPDDLALDDVLPAPLASAHHFEKRSYIANARLKPAYFGHGDGKPRVVTVKDGYLVVVDFAITTIVTGKKGSRLYWKKPFDQLNQTVGSTKLTSKVVVSTALMIPDAGVTSVLGTSIDDVLAYGGRLTTSSRGTNESRTVARRRRRMRVGRGRMFG